MKRSASSTSSKSSADGTIQNVMTEDISVSLASDKGELKRTITFTTACAILMANIGGASIFISPTTVLTYAGSQGMALIVWLLGGVIQLGMALSVTELTLIFQKAGGPYFFVLQTFGELPGFISLWGFVIFIAGSTWALNAYACSLYILTNIWTDCPPSHDLVVFFASFIMITLIVVNCTYMELTTSLQKVFTGGKIFALLCVMVVGLAYIPTETGRENLETTMEGTNQNIGPLSMALFASYYSFGGWQILCVMVEEVKNPERVLPLSMLTSFFILIATIVFSIFSYGVLLSKEEMLKSDAIAVQFGHMVHPALSVFLSVSVTVVNIGCLNVLIMGQPRMLYAAGHNKQMPKMMTLVHRRFKTPWPATIALGIMGIITLQRGSVTTLVDTISLYAGIMSIMVLLCLFKLRWSQPEAHRPFKIPIIFPILIFILSLVLIVLSVMTKPKEMGLVILIFILAVPVYYVCIKWQKPAGLFRYVDVFTDYLKLSLDLV